MFKKAVRISVDICPADHDKQEESTIHTISIVLESGPVHRFKKLCEKLQLILLSNQRRSISNCRAEEGNNEEYRVPDEKDASSNNSKLQLTQLSDTESEGEVLDSPRTSTEGVSTNMNGKETEKNG